MCAVVAVGQELPQNTDEIGTLTVEQAKALAQHYGELRLNGITTLSPEVAKELTQHCGRLHLNGITELSVEAATALAQHKGFLHLDGLTTLSVEAAEALSHQCDGLSLNRLTTLSPEVAKALAQHYGGLHLNGITKLSVEAATALSQYDGWLHLDGLAKLSPEAAEALLQHKGELSLKRLTTLSPKAAKASTDTEHADHAGVSLDTPGALGFVVVPAWELTDDSWRAWAQKAGGNGDVTKLGVLLVSPRAAKKSCAAGLHVGNIILSIGGRRLTDENDWQQAMGLLVTGKPIKMRVRSFSRSWRWQDVDVVPVDRQKLAEFEKEAEKAQRERELQQATRGREAQEAALNRVYVLSDGKKLTGRQIEEHNKSVKAMVVRELLMIDAASLVRMRIGIDVLQHVCAAAKQNDWGRAREIAAGALREGVAVAVEQAISLTSIGEQVHSLSEGSALTQAEIWTLSISKLFD
jgi:hypothetical protein